MNNFIRTIAITVALALPTISVAGDPTVGFEKTDPVMNKAIGNAIGSLDLFLNAVSNTSGHFHADGSLKVAFVVNSADMTAEIIWVDNLRLKKNGQFTGRLANEPNAMPGLKHGSKVRFSKDQIRDWGFFASDQKLYGHYTTRVLVKQLPKDQAAGILSVLSRKPVPAGWK